jgi:hypothetical protein
MIDINLIDFKSIATGLQDTMLLGYCISLALGILLVLTYVVASIQVKIYEYINRPKKEGNNGK